MMTAGDVYKRQPHGQYLSDAPRRQRVPPFRYPPSIKGRSPFGAFGWHLIRAARMSRIKSSAREMCIRDRNGLVDLYLGRLVLLLYGSGHEIGLVVLIGNGELDRGRIEHMALRSLGLDEGIGCGTGTEIEFLGGGGSIVTGGHMVDDLSLGRTHGAIGGDDILLRDDIVLCIFEILAVIGAGLGDGRLPHDLPVEDLYDCLLYTSRCV